MKTRLANHYARQRYIDKLLDEHDGDINAVIILVAEITGRTVSGTARLVNARARARGYDRARARRCA